ncbi:DUF294 nucleotidyltransferase-like domain-containing protein [Novispirillum itersonii]|uniref:Signal-transduction protein with cAMP-binding, CBS, and nucleotidyltransferase domain n=1 Tax=Novispirillum itersonii TaxID=189 RepID=A0A7W9ZID9_NOVIT|nr:DUF294 nucleotidyltransferase-like domain-containing protein [Novispirillum itersonii]MBB6211212.1 signal-transduction protein with cAMP-binding, CBS, and nucleotidyltransferase domain [Novispirillum itersonii]
MVPESLRGLDSFPYRHRVREVMRTPAVTVGPDCDLATAAAVMLEQNVSALFTIDAAGQACGIITEKDVLRALTRLRDGAAVAPLAGFLSSPVAFVRENAFVYMALGRMDRLNIRHLAVIDGHERVIGLVTARDLLRLRAAESLRIGDAVRAATDATGLAEARTQLPQLVESLLAEGLTAVQVAAVVSAVYADMTRRAAQLTESALQADPAFGPAPARWTVLILGSGGRGESLLAPDQDNAILHAGTEADDPWFAEAGIRLSALLDAAGIPFCKGGVMASRPEWRHSLDGWRRQVGRWLEHPDPESLLKADIFFDFMPVFGDAGLAATLRDEVTERSRGALSFLHGMAAHLDGISPPVGLFGRLKTQQGRVDLKRHGLFPLVAGARIMALHQGIAATATADRLLALLQRQILPEADLKPLLAAQDCLIRVILRQQGDDLRAGTVPGVRVDPSRFDRADRAAVVSAVRQCARLPQMLRDSFDRVRPRPR